MNTDELIDMLAQDGWCQRWRRQVDSWRPVSEGGFDQRRYTVEPVTRAQARTFVLEHHYSASFPAASRRFKFGLWEGRHLVGVAVFGIPARREVLTGPFPALVPYVESFELSRLVLLDEVPANAESWFVAEVFRAAREGGVRGVVAFSDPMPRRAVDGQLVMPGHVGTVYKALNGRYTGRGTARTLWLLPDGMVFNARRRAKVTGGESGGGGPVRQLTELGARPPKAGQDMSAWVKTALEQVGARSVPHRGCHRYVWGIGSRHFRRKILIGLPSEPFPTTIDPVCDMALVRA